MQKEMLNINGNLIGDVEIKTILGKDFIHVYGYYKEVQKADKTYRNFIVKHVNKIDKEMENKKEQEENEEE